MSDTVEFISDPLKATSHKNGTCIHFNFIKKKLKPGKNVFFCQDELTTTINTSLSDEIYDVLKAGNNVSIVRDGKNLIFNVVLPSQSNTRIIPGNNICVDNDESNLCISSMWPDEVYRNSVETQNDENILLFSIPMEQKSIRFLECTVIGIDKVTDDTAVIQYKNAYKRSSNDVIEKIYSDDLLQYGTIPGAYVKYKINGLNIDIYVTNYNCCSVSWTGTLISNVHRW